MIWTNVTSYHDLIKMDKENQKSGEKGFGVERRKLVMFLMQNSPASCSHILLSGSNVCAYHQKRKQECGPQIL